MKTTIRKPRYKAPRISEGAILKSILEYLAAKHILAFRQNTGAVEAVYKGKTRFMRFGVPGMADILAFKIRRSGWLVNPVIKGDYAKEIIIPLWIEVKAENGVQSDLQKSFQAQVESHGHRYIIARSIEDVEAAL